jgi:hypothetical protein
MTAPLLFCIVGTRCVERAGLRGLAEGQRIAILKTQKGREAISFALIVTDAALTSIKARPLSS